MKFINLKGKQEKSWKYLEAVLALRDEKNALVKEKGDTLATIAALRAQLEDVNAHLGEATDEQICEALRTERKALQEALEDIEAVKLDIFGKVEAMNADLQLLRTAAKGEIDTLIDAADMEINSIQEQAKEAILSIRAAIDAHPFTMGDKIIEDIIGHGGWQVIESP